MPLTRSGPTSPSRTGTSEWLVVDRDLASVSKQLSKLRDCPVYWQSSVDDRHVIGYALNKDGTLVELRVVSRAVHEHRLRAPPVAAGSDAAALIQEYESKERARTRTPASDERGSTKERSKSRSSNPFDALLAESDDESEGGPAVRVKRRTAESKAREMKEDERSAETTFLFGRFCREQESARSRTRSCALARCPVR